MRAVIPELEQGDWLFDMHQLRLRSPAAKSRGPEARLVGGGTFLPGATAWSPTQPAQQCLLGGFGGTAVRWRRGACFWGASLPSCTTTGS